tara:strand:- start:281 stop:1819 length:1539 start_codon:yes stop_codon:yes gene_type:complete
MRRHHEHFPDPKESNLNFNNNDHFLNEDILIETNFLARKYEETIKLIKIKVDRIKNEDKVKYVYNNTTPLHYALEKSYLEIAKILIKDGRYNKIRDTCYTVDFNVDYDEYIDKECDNIKGTFVSNNYLIEYARFKGNTPLNLACKKGFTEIAKLLIDHDGNVEYEDLDFFQPIHNASIYGHTDIVDYILQDNPEYKNSRISGDDVGENSDYKDYSPLEFACENGRIEIVELLINKYNSYINGYSYFSPLLIAIIHNQNSVAKFLIDNGSDLQYTGILYTEDLPWQRNYIKPLHMACMQNNIEVIKYLFENNIDFNTLDDENVSRPIHVACRDSNIEVVRYLIDIGVDVNSLDGRNNKTAINYACISNVDSEEKINLLIQKGCDIHNPNTENPLVTACYYENYIAIKTFISHNVDYSCLYENGKFTPCKRKILCKYKINHHPCHCSFRGDVKDFLIKEINWFRLKKLILNAPHKDHKTNIKNKLSSLGEIITASKIDEDSIYYQLKIKIAKYI